MNKKFRVLISVPYPRTEPLKKILEEIAEVDEKHLNQKELEEEIKKDNYDALICWEFSQRITREMLLSANSRLKIVATISVGYDHIDTKTAEEKGIKVINAGMGDMCASTYSVAEFVFWLLLTLVRKTRYIFDSVEKNSPTWSELSQGGIIGSELFGKTLGIIGVGRIGSHVARIGRGFCMKVIGYDPYVNPEKALQSGAKLVDRLEELLSNSDIVSINCCLTDETRAMIGKHEVSLMKKGIYLVDTARGEIVDENSILEGLRSKKIAGYTADVLTGEPPTEKSSPLLASYRHREKLNLLISPHIAWTSEEGIAKRYPLIIGNRVKGALLGKDIREKEVYRK